MFRTTKAPYFLSESQALCGDGRDLARGKQGLGRGVGAGVSRELVEVMTAV